MNQVRATLYLPLGKCINRGLDSNTLFFKSLKMKVSSCVLTLIVAALASSVRADGVDHSAHSGHASLPGRGNKGKYGYGPVDPDVKPTTTSTVAPVAKTTTVAPVAKSTTTSCTTSETAAPVVKTTTTSCTTSTTASLLPTLKTTTKEAYGADHEPTLKPVITVPKETPMPNSYPEAYGSKSSSSSAPRFTTEPVIVSGASQMAVSGMTVVSIMMLLM